MLPTSLKTTHFHVLHFQGSTQLYYLCKQYVNVVTL